MNEPSLRQLRYLVVLSECLHFGDAAAQCGVSQPNLSAQIKELEKSLDAQLVERTSRQVILTPVGEEIVESARKVLREVDELMDVAESNTDPLAGRIRLGVIPTVAPYVLPRVLPTVREMWPELELHLVEDFTDRLIPRLSSGELDMLLLALPVANTGLHSEELINEPFVLLTPHDHELAKQKRVTVDSFDPTDLLLLQEGHCLRDQALELCHIDRHNRKSGLEGSSLTTLVQMVANGLGTTLLPLIAVGVDVPTNNEISVLPFRKPQPGRTLGLIWRDTSSKSDAYREFAQVLRSELKRLLQDSSRSIDAGSTRK